jgi:NADPH-dependent 2,4-dienoyl-CoA reductase/sulfur reductase-like enzyme
MFVRGQRERVLWCSGPAALKARDGRHRIALIGGGIGGLAAALALTRRGFSPTVYEQSSEIKEKAPAFR